MGNDASGGGSQSQPPTSRPDRPPPGIPALAGEWGEKPRERRNQGKAGRRRPIFSEAPRDGIHGNFLAFSRAGRAFKASILSPDDPTLQESQFGVPIAPWEHYNSPGFVAMHILFERTGGFAGLKLQASLDAESLPPQQARRFRKLLQQSRFFELPLRLDAPLPRPDRLQYRLTIENNNCVHTVHASEDAIPPEMRPLLDWLTAAARRQR